MKKHFICLILLITAVICGSFTIASAEENKLKSGIFSYKINGSGVTIVGVDDVAGRVEVPEEIEGYAVTALGDGAFGGREHTTEVYLPDSVKTIGKTCFAYSKSIKRVRLSRALKTISEGAFYQCEALMGISVPYGVEDVRDNAFAMCSSLSSVSVASTVKSIADNAFSGSDAVVFYCKLNDEPYAKAYAESKNIVCENMITVYVNENEVDFDQAPITDKVNFRTLVPLRPVLELMGAEIEWFDDMGYAGIDVDGHRLLIKPEAAFMRADGKTVWLSSPAIEYNNRIMVPIRDVVEAIKGKNTVVWNENATSVEIKY